jgi:hypothetical protein
MMQARRYFVYCYIGVYDVTFGFGIDISKLELWSKYIQTSWNKVWTWELFSVP